MAHLRAFPRARPGRGASASETWPLSFPLPSMMLWVIHSPDNAGANTGLLPSCRHRWTRNTKLQQLRESQPLNPLRARAKVVRVSHAHEMLNRIQSSPQQKRPQFFFLPVDKWQVYSSRGIDRFARAGRTRRKVRTLHAGRRLPAPARPPGPAPGRGADDWDTELPANEATPEAQCRPPPLARPRATGAGSVARLNSRYIRRRLSRLLSSSFQTSRRTGPVAPSAPSSSSPFKCRGGRRTEHAP